MIRPMLQKFGTQLCRSRFSTSVRRCRAKVIDGKAMAREIQDEVKADIAQWMAAGNRQPQLTAILVGTDPASHVYVRNKMKAAEYTGISSEAIHMPASTSEGQLISLIRTLNNEDGVDGILVQLPLPAHINERYICDTVAPWKDVDAFNVVNVGRFCCDVRTMVPATPAGVIEMIRRTGIETVGKNAVVCGRSKNVGMPIAMLIHSDSKNGSKTARNIQKPTATGPWTPGDATTIICHRNTPPDQLRMYTRTADILIVATGIPGLITADMIKEGAAVIDVGITQVTDKDTGKRHLIGDVDFKGVSEKAGYITPVPGGVGPMTIAMLLRNTLIAARREIDYGVVHERTRREPVEETLTSQLSRMSYSMIMKLLRSDRSTAYDVNRRKS